MIVPEIEISVKYKNRPEQLMKLGSSSRQCYEVVKQLFNADQILWVEEFIMICLNRQGEMLGYYKVSKGGFTCTVVDVKVVATIALQCCASDIIVAHNHPSGNTKPSDADKYMTAKLKEGLQTLDIRLIDHLIITEENYLSFSDEGLL